MDHKKPRVRFAPSPTGELHLGGARTALFNYLYAKNNDGNFLLRIEDTDKQRSKQEYTDQICESLKWLRLDWDEEIVYQSQRTQLYKKAVEQLVGSGNAYHCFCTKEKITDDRRQAEQKGGAYLYPQTCRYLDKKDVKDRIESGEEYSIRIKIPQGRTSFSDKIYGHIDIDNTQLDDFIIARTDGSPVYNLVVVVDDSVMGITHVIRGEDHVSNTHKQIIIYMALELAVPQFAHLPMILGPDKKRLSKRHGATGVQEYKDKGYLSQVMTNYLALLGWNPGTDQEIFNIDQLVSEFSIERVQKKSAVFDEKKLEWVNKQHIQQRSSSELYLDIKSINNNWILDKDNNYLLKVIDLMKERVNNLNDFETISKYFFEDPTEFEGKAVRKRWKDSSVNHLMQKFVRKLNNIDKWNHKNIEQALRKLAEEDDLSAGEIIHPTRLAVSGVSSGPSLFDMMVLLGKDVCIRRIEKALSNLPN